jgi:hypothetical protein
MGPVQPIVDRSVVRIVGLRARKVRDLVVSIAMRLQRVPHSLERVGLLIRGRSLGLAAPNVNRQKRVRLDGQLVQRDMLRGQYEQLPQILRKLHFGLSRHPNQQV